MAYTLPKQRIAGGINADEEYWKHLLEGEFCLPRCARCNTWTWPAHFRCGKCGCWDFEWSPLVPRGHIFSWTRSWYAFDRVSERAEDIPYVTVLAEIPEACGARVLGILKGSEETLRIGATVEGSIEPPSQKSKGYPSICWRIVNRDIFAEYTETGVDNE